MTDKNKSLIKIVCGILGMLITLWGGAYLAYQIRPDEWFAIPSFITLIFAGASFVILFTEGVVNYGND